MNFRNLEDLVRFPGIASCFTPLSYATKMMFSREIELNKVKEEYKKLSCEVSWKVLFLHSFMNIIIMALVKWHFLILALVVDHK